jgi:hypothetical protein
MIYIVTTQGGVVYTIPLIFSSDTVDWIVYFYFGMVPTITGPAAAIHPRAKIKCMSHDVLNMMKAVILSLPMHMPIYIE